MAAKVRFFVAFFMFARLAAAHELNSARLQSEAPTSFGLQSYQLAAHGSWRGIQARTHIDGQRFAQQYRRSSLAALLGYSIFSGWAPLIGGRTSTEVLPTLSAEEHSSELLLGASWRGKWARLLSWRGSNGNTFVSVVGRLSPNVELALSFSKSLRVEFGIPVQRFGGLRFALSASGELSTGVWALIAESTDLQLGARLPRDSGGNLFVQVGVTFRFKKVSSAVPPRVINRLRPKKKREKVAPSFQTMVRWGVSPAQALRISKSKNVCSAGSRARKILARHKWRCYR